ncbi:CPBP family intramembrane glutamic endopeptidase [Stakelama saccharophila]|uniref:CPBP family intramembrane glutamic endopeptidase n=1 Tax=Stakelama saccharophila TaxID=3075605 RepID=A0ABZ0BAC8_9SPHN|nr:CPBP family intramembrane glutamic endopeptidase [Stakelama sp. W311]WNO54229.1 CPBP family intramembrane glutamic endopeptidase [Stakelama sp. W311]
MVVALTLIALAAYVLFLKGRLADRLGIDRFDRAAMYRFWVVKALLLFALPSLLALVLLGRMDLLIVMPAGFARAALAVGILPGAWRGDATMLQTMTAGLIGGGLLGVVIARWRMRRGRRPWMLGEVGQVLPRHRGELPWTLLLSLTAGVTEELYFRLLLPLLSLMLLGAALPGFALSLILFALAHGYQRWLGMAGALALGVIFTAVYWLTASLWVTMALHALVDCNSLFLRPLLLGLPPAPVSFSGDSRS